MLRIAHVSDLHVLSPLGSEWRQALFNKRMTGYANVLLRRGRVFRREYLLAVLEAAAVRADHVVVTGDITNLALESEYTEARRLLDRLARTREVTVVPGNHDIYLPQIAHEGRFFSHFEPFLQSDLPSLATRVPAGHFPCVKLRGPAAFIALSSAVPRPPFVSAGFVGHAQLEALRGVLAHPEVSRRTPVLLIHHDPLDSGLRVEQLRSGLVDARRLREALSPLTRGLVLFGHLHVRRRRRLTTQAGMLEVVCASGASLDHPDERVRAGFNLYTMAADGNVASIEAWVLDPSTLTLVRRALSPSGGST
ncbi:MAG TPA: metallophosphoesterase [Polyangiaceae bacterium]